MTTSRPAAVQLATRPTPLSYLTSRLDRPMSFARGTHIRVWRQAGLIGYYHHGIYVSADRVIQFGGGIRDKPSATIAPVTLEEFERGEQAETVEHGGRTWWGAPRFPGVPPETAIRRAERLVEMRPRALYNLFGFNCEQAANFCCTNSYESYQVRGYFAVRMLFGNPLNLWIAHRMGSDRRLSTRASVALVIWLLTGILPNLLYYRTGERFMREVGRPLLDWERRQADDA